MSEATVTLTGNLVADPALRVVADGVPVAGFRMATTPRRYDRETGEWRDGETTYLTVNCWRALGEHVVASLRRGDAVLVTGRLSVREYENRDGDRRLAVEVEATAVGPDLGRGTAQVTRIRRMPGSEDAPGAGGGSGADGEALAPGEAEPEEPDALVG